MVPKTSPPTPSHSSVKTWRPLVLREIINLFNDFKIAHGIRLIWIMFAMYCSFYAFITNHLKMPVVKSWAKVFLLNWQVWSLSQPNLLKFTKLIVRCLPAISVNNYNCLTYCSIKNVVITEDCFNKGSLIEGKLCFLVGNSLCSGVYLWWQ